jgi:hypothetical protein
VEDASLRLYNSLSLRHPLSRLTLTQEKKMDSLMMETGPETALAFCFFFNIQ